MKLCMALIADKLMCCQDDAYKSKSEDEFNLERWEIYCGGACLCSGVLYLAEGSSLNDDIIIQEDSALISIGELPQMNTDGLRLLVLDADVGFFELCNEIGRIFFEYTVLEQRLRQFANEGQSIQTLLNQISPYIGNSITVMNSDFRMLAVSHGPDATDEILKSMPLTDDGMIPPEIVSFFESDIRFVQAKNYREPFIYEASVFPWSTLCMNIFYLDEFVARVSISENQRPFRAYDAGLLSFLASNIQLVYDLSESTGANIMPQSHLTEVCIDLLRSNAVESWRIRNCLISHGWERDNLYIVASILPKSHEHYNRMLSYYTQLISQDYPGCIAFEYDSRIVVLINLRYYDNSVDKFISLHIENIRDFNFRLGFSNVFASVTELRPYYTQAEIALRIGTDVYPEVWRHSFSDLVLPYMLSRLTDELDGKYLCAPEVIELHEYDKRNGSDFLKTLKVYIECQMNAVQTAKELFIHRATMVYRLERIKKLTGLDYNDPDSMLWVDISIRLMEQTGTF